LNDEVVFTKSFTEKLHTIPKRCRDGLPKTTESRCGDGSMLASLASRRNRGILHLFRLLARLNAGKAGHIGAT